MTTTDKILVLLGTILSVWQFWIFAQAYAMMRDPRVRPGSVRYGLAPGLAAAVFFILAVMI